MISIYSLQDKSLLHIIRKFSEIQNQQTIRNDLSNPDAFLQIASLNLTKNSSFQAHIHNKNDVKHNIYWSQECWVVLKGSVEVSYFDTDKSLIYTHILNSGDISISFNGGHAYTALTNNTLVYEFKSGPYLGKELDKTII